MTENALWTPTADRIDRSRMTAFMRMVEERYRITFAEYHELWSWSVQHRDQFWSAVWDFCKVIHAQRGDEILVEGHRMPGAHWFPGARLNFAENLLRFNDDRPALIFWNENGRQRVVSFQELKDDVSRFASWLRSIGIGSNDRVASMLPNVPEAVVVMLATASIGATFSSCSPDFGVEGIIDRFGQIEPTLLITADGYIYAGKTFDSVARATEVTNRIASIKQTVVIPYVNHRATFETIPNSICWDDLPSDSAEIRFEALPFDHPLYILYSSGTTGRPKCIVHGAGGTLLQHLKEHQLHTDITRDDRLFYVTTCGWMMWNWLVSGLASGCTLILYDGSPMHPSPMHLMDMVDAERITVFGTGARYIAALEKSGSRPIQTHRLADLRTVLSTGSPLSESNFGYVYSSIKEDVCLSSISGGTDIISCFALGNPNLPVYPGELQCRGLGMGVEVYDQAGRPVIQQQGELVCVSAFPSMPIRFWDDPRGEKYHRAYFDRFPGIWCHGDYSMLTLHGGLVIYGRSDATLNPGGVRIGTAEIYRLVDQLPEVIESVAIGQTWSDDIRVILFVRLRNGTTLDDDLVARIKEKLRFDASPRHVPAKVIQVADIPRTRSGKIVELAVHQVVHNRPVENLGALANPDSLKHFRDLADLQRA